jgi:hypothetical protein
MFALVKEYIVPLLIIGNGGLIGYVGGFYLNKLLRKRTWNEDIVIQLRYQRYITNITMTFGIAISVLVVTALNQEPEHAPLRQAVLGVGFFCYVIIFYNKIRIFKLIENNTGWKTNK